MIFFFLTIYNNLKKDVLKSFFLGAIFIVLQ